MLVAAAAMRQLRLSNTFMLSSSDEAAICNARILSEFAIAYVISETLLRHVPDHSTDSISF
jgi:hypothetical protein